MAGAKQERVARRKEEGGGLFRRSCVCVFGSGNSGHEWGLAIRSGGRAGIPRPFLRSGVNAAAVAGRGLPSPPLRPHAAAVISPLVA